MKALLSEAVLFKNPWVVNFRNKLSPVSKTQHFFFLLLLHNTWFIFCFGLVSHLMTLPIALREQQDNFFFSFLFFPKKAFGDRGQGLKSLFTLGKAVSASVLRSSRFCCFTFLKTGTPALRSAKAELFPWS